MENPIILIVEDDPALLKLYGYIIEKAGYRLITADSARAAIDLLNHTIPHLIIQDLSLPDLSGLQLIDCVRQREDCANIPVIIISGSLGRIESAKLANKNFIAFLHKPIDPEELLKTINDCLQGKQPT